MHLLFASEQQHNSEAIVIRFVNENGAINELKLRVDRENQPDGQRPDVMLTQHRPHDLVGVKRDL